MVLYEDLEALERDGFLTEDNAEFEENPSEVASEIFDDICRKKETIEFYLKQNKKKKFNNGKDKESIKKFLSKALNETSGYLGKLVQYLNKNDEEGCEILQERYKNDIVEIEEYLKNARKETKRI